MRFYIIVLLIFLAVNIAHAVSVNEYVDAAAKGDLQTVKKAIENGIDIKAEGEQTRSAIIEAAKNGRIEVLKYFFQKGISPDYTDSGKYYTLLQAAAKYGQMETVKFLVENGANIDFMSSEWFGYTAISLAAAENHLDIVEYIVKKGGDINLHSKKRRNAFLEACYKDRVDIADRLIKLGADIHSVGTEGNALTMAAEKGEAEKVKYWLKKGLSPETQREDGFNSLLIATEREHLEIVQILLDAGADINASCLLGTALHRSLTYENKDMVKLLVAKGADLHKTDNRGATPLNLAVWIGLEFVMIIADTFPESVIDTGKSRVVIPGRTVVKSDISINLPDSDGQTPLIRASSSGLADITGFLVTHGADVNAVDRWGWTPLMHAVNSGNADCVKILLNNGADKNKTSTAKTEPGLDDRREKLWPAGTTALKIAQGKKNRKIIEMLKFQ